jgi:hypothetical protein
MAEIAPGYRHHSTQYYDPRRMKSYLVVLVARAS